jgi:hypothetical protein
VRNKRQPTVNSLFHVFVSAILAQTKIPVLIFLFYQAAVSGFFVGFVMRKKLDGPASLLSAWGQMRTGIFGLQNLVNRRIFAACAVHALLLLFLA